MTALTSCSWTRFEKPVAEVEPPPASALERCPTLVGPVENYPDPIAVAAATAVWEYRACQIKHDQTIEYIGALRKHGVVKE